MRNQNSGQSIVEVIIALAVVILLLTASFALISSSLGQAKLNRETRSATDLSKQLAENIYSYSLTNWGDIYGSATGSVNKFYLTVSSTSGSLYLLPGYEEINLNNVTFTRYVVFEEFIRDGSAGPSIRKTTVNVDWATTTTKTGRNTNIVLWLYRNTIRGFSQSDWAP